MSEKPRTNMWDDGSELDETDMIVRAFASERAVRPARPDIGTDIEKRQLEGAAPQQCREPLVSKAQADAPRRKLRSAMVAAIALIAISGTAFFYVEGTQTATSNTTSASPETAELTDISPTVTYEQEAVLAPQDSPFETVPEAEPRLSADAAKEKLDRLLADTAPIGPLATLSDAHWRGAECSSCHTWTEANLCDQGQWYEQHGDAAINRVGHPYGGEFKQNLLTWAKHDCQ